MTRESFEAWAEKEYLDLGKTDDYYIERVTEMAYLAYCAAQKDADKVMDELAKALTNFIDAWENNISESDQHRKCSKACDEAQQALTTAKQKERQ